MTAEVDPVHGSVRLPADKLGISFLEREILLGAETAAKAECGRAMGVPWTGSEPLDDPAYGMSNPFGPWTEQMANKFAFVTPMSDQDLVANGYAKGSGKTLTEHPNSRLTEEQLDRIAACRGDAHVKRFEHGELAKRGPWVVEFEKSYDRTLKDSRAQQVFGELRACYAERGMTFDETMPGFITAANGKIDAEQIALALKVVECQKETDATRRLADIQADLQAPIVEKYADELVAQRARIDEALVEAEAYVAQHPELFEAPK